MKRNLKKLIVLTPYLLLLLSLPLHVSAQTNPAPTPGVYTVLAPLPNLQNAQNQTTLETYIPNAFKLAIGIAVIMAFVMITFGGIMYATSDSLTGKSSGRGYIEGAVLGLLLCIGAYAILWTINPRILVFNLSIKQVPQTGVPLGPTIASNAFLAGTVGGVLQGYTLTAAEVEADKQVRLNIQSTNRVTVEKAACATGATTGCTNVVYLPNSAVSGLKNLAAACNCSLVVTGGTEGGHATHGPNRANVDIRPSDELNKHLAKTNPAAAAPINGTVVQVNGGTYTYETTGANGRATGNHWHVSY